MDKPEFIGYLVSAIITLGSFIAVIIKFIQPINNLLITVQKINDNIDAIKNDNGVQNQRIEKHGEQIYNLDRRVGKIETKIETFHDHKQ